MKEMKSDEVNENEKKKNEEKRITESNLQHQERNIERKQDDDARNTQ